MTDRRPPACVVITAPTACGKTALAMRLAAHRPVEIISMDSAMVFRGLDIGTAKPTAAERARVPHHLIDILDPAARYSAGQFVADAQRLASEIQGRGAVPLIVGGTMMYLRALRNGLAELPPADPGVRAAIDAEAAAAGWPALHQQLAAVDPRAAARIAVNDRQRIQRALEVFRISGRPLSRWQRSGARPALALRTVALMPADRADLRLAIARRFDAMLAAGFMAEVQALYDRGDLSPDKPSMRCVGYRQLWRVCTGEASLSEAAERAVIATRQLAKRQLTWLRSDPGDQACIVGDREPPVGALLRVIDSVTQR